MRCVDEGREVVRGDCQRDGAQLGVLRQPERRLDDAGVGGGDQHALRLLQRPRRALGRQRQEVERRVVRGEGQVPLELEADHVARLSVDRR